MYMETSAENQQTQAHTGTNPTRLRNQELEQQIAELAAQINVANYRQLSPANANRQL